jgi:hypothetical protein
MLLIQVVFCIQLTPRASIHPVIGFQSAIRRLPMSIWRICVRGFALLPWPARPYMFWWSRWKTAAGSEAAKSDGT